MIKRFFLALALAAGLLGSAHASGTIPFSLSQQLDQYGKPLSGCLFYTIQAGTTSTPQNAYQDSALTIPLPNPQTCDAAGRLPQMFFADGTIKVRLTDKNGVTVVVADNIQVIGASSGSGGGGTVDPTTILTTGDIKVTYGTGSVTGFVRANGRTIGSATSGATERANSDVQALFEYLWSADSNLTVSGGRGASAAADWAANKTIALPDFRSRSLMALSDMGNTADTSLDSLTFARGNSTTLGGAAGAVRSTLAQTNLPAIAPTFSGTAATIGGSLPGVVTTSSGFINLNVSTGSSGVFGIVNPLTGTNFSASYTPQGTISTLGSGTSFATISPFVLVTFYLKL